MDKGERQSRLNKLEELKAKARQGDAAAQTRLAFHYARAGGAAEPSLAGDETNARPESDFQVAGENSRQAAFWYEQAARQGIGVAQYNLAAMFLNGIGVEKNLQTAFEWFLKAAQQGDCDAQFNVAMLYERGQGVEQSLEEARNWYLLAAESGSGRAQYDLALIYQQGKGVERDAEKARYWFRRALESGVARAAAQLA